MTPFPPVLLTLKLKLVDEHLDPTDPEQFRIDFSSLPASVSAATPTPARASTPTSVMLQQQGQSAHHVPTVDGAYSLQQAEPVVTPSTSSEHSPVDTFDSIVSAQTSITSDLENTQVENTQQQTHDAIAPA